MRILIVFGLFSISLSIFYFDNNENYITINSIIPFKQTVYMQPEIVSVNKIKNFMNNKNVTKKIIVIKNDGGYGNQI